MPLVKAKFTRGDKPFPVRVGSFDYLFQLSPSGDYVADVGDPEHYNHLMQTKNFAPYTPPTLEELEARELERARAAKAAASAAVKASAKAEAKSKVALEKTASEKPGGAKPDAKGE